MQTKTTTFGDEAAFLKLNAGAIILSDRAGKSKIAVSPKLQGRVLTSTAAGDDGLSFGWINRALISSGKTAEHINAYGGEDRFWLGPEGGQYAIFFKTGAPFDVEHCFTPAAIDTEPFELIGQVHDRIQMKTNMRLQNYAGTVFDLRVDREAALLEFKDAVRLLNIELPANVSLAAFQTNNRITNTGRSAWTKTTGMLSIWSLGMFNSSQTTTVVMPYKTGNVRELGPVVNDAYFGKVPGDRLVIGKNAVFFKADGQYRSKIGLSPTRAQPVLGSYDAANKVLTIVQYSKPAGVVDYINSMWEIQKEPFHGDVINSYNSGPAKPGANSLGPFYELETSSPAAALAPGKSLEHVHRTFHFQGTETDLEKITRAIFGLSIRDIIQAFVPNR